MNEKHESVHEQRQEVSSALLADASQQPRQSNKFPWKIAILGCGIGLFIGCCLCLVFTAASVGILALIGSKEPTDLEVEYVLPYSVNVGDEFDLIISLTNTGDQTLNITDIDLDGAFSGSILDGAIVTSTDPDMERDYSVPGVKSFHYNTAIQPHSSSDIRFLLLAQVSGEFGGRIDIYTNSFESKSIYPVITIRE